MYKSNVNLKYLDSKYIGKLSYGVLQTFKANSENVSM